MPHPPITTPIIHPAPGAHIQRTMRLLAESTPQKHQRAKILVYGQSLSKQEWWLEVKRDLEERFPHTDLDMRNRSVGGFSSARLIHALQQDVIPEYPDLVIFHVAGDHRRYEDIVRTVRTQTTAEMLIWTGPPSELPADDAPDGQWRGHSWGAMMDYDVVPAIARRYGCGLADVRTPWQVYMEQHGLTRRDFARSATDNHFNEFGNWMLAELLKPYFVRDPSLDTQSPVHEYVVGEDLHWHDGVLELPFTGNRVDLVAVEGGTGSARVLIDNRTPSSFAECYSFTRPNDIPGEDWPWTVASMIRVDAGAPLLEETWTVRLRDISEDCASFAFTLEGSKTGPDGEGGAGERFVSNSGRVIIEPHYWWLAEARKLLKTRFEPGNEIQWHVTKHAVDTYKTPPEVDPTREHITTLAQGIPNGKHVLRLEGEVGVERVRVYEGSRMGGWEAGKLGA